MEIVGNTMILNRSDLLGRARAYSFRSIDLSDFIIGTYHHNTQDIIIFEDIDGERKILQSRFGVDEIIDNPRKDLNKIIFGR